MNLILTLPNGLTAIRIILVPFICVSIICGALNLAFLLFVIAALTDVFDGWLARYLKCESVLGSYLDPIADKLLMISSFFCFTFYDVGIYKMPIWFLGFMIFKELLLVLGGAYLAYKGSVIKIEPGLFGKLATLFQVLFIWFLFISMYMTVISFALFYFFIALILILSMCAFLQYTLQLY